MQRITAVVNLKGGVGKSTLTVSLGIALWQEGRRVLLVDADPQGTLRTWAARAAARDLEGPPVVAIEGRALRRDLPMVAEGFDVVLVDTPPRLGLEARSAMMAADALLLPVTPGAADVWALEETLGVYGEARALRPELGAHVVLNRCDRTTLTGLAEKALTELGVAMLPPVRQRVAFGEAMLAGEGVGTYAPGSDAALDVRRLARSLGVSSRLEAAS